MNLIFLALALSAYQSIAYPQYGFETDTNQISSSYKCSNDTLLLNKSGTYLAFSNFRKQINDHDTIKKAIVINCPKDFGPTMCIESTGNSYRLIKRINPVVNNMGVKYSVIRVEGLTAYAKAVTNFSTDLTCK